MSPAGRSAVGGGRPARVAAMILPITDPPALSQAVEGVCYPFLTPSVQDLSSSVLLTEIYLEMSGVRMDEGI